MNTDFAVNTSFQPLEFNKTISGINKTFDGGFSQKTDGVSDFDKIFNSIKENPLNASVSIDVNTADKVSPTQNAINNIGNSISNGLNDLNTIQRQAENDLETFASGGDISVHDVMISAQKSSLSMQMAIQLRNKIINAYNELKSINI